MNDPELLTKLSDSLDAQHKLVYEVAKLNTAGRRMRWIIRILAFIVVALAVAGIVSLKASHDADAARRQGDRDRAATTLVTCRIRNYSARETRRAIDAATAGTDARFRELLTNLKIAFPGIAPFVDEQLAIPRKPTTPADDDVDTDCTKDGRLDAGDYPSPELIATFTSTG